MSAQELSIEGQVTDIQGAKLASAQVIIHWDRGVSIGVPDNIGIKRDLKLSTDLKGHYKAVVPSGFYDVFISAPAFWPVATKVRVKHGQSARFDAALKLAPAVMGSPD